MEAKFRRSQRHTWAYTQHRALRPGQLEAIVSALHGRDVFARMALRQQPTMLVALLSYSTKAVGVTSPALVTSVGRFVTVAFEGSEL